MGTRLILAGIALVAVVLALLGRDAGDPAAAFALDLTSTASPAAAEREADVGHHRESLGAYAAPAGTCLTFVSHLRQRLTTSEGEPAEASVTASWNLAIADGEPDGSRVVRTELVAASVDGHALPFARVWARLTDARGFVELACEGRPEPAHRLLRVLLLRTHLPIAAAETWHGKAIDETGTYDYWARAVAGTALFTKEPSRPELDAQSTTRIAFDDWIKDVETDETLVAAPFGPARSLRSAMVANTQRVGRTRCAPPPVPALTWLAADQPFEEQEPDAPVPPLNAALSQLEDAVDDDGSFGAAWGNLVASLTAADQRRQLLQRLAAGDLVPPQVSETMARALMSALVAAALRVGEAGIADVAAALAVVAEASAQEALLIALHQLREVPADTLAPVRERLRGIVSAASANQLTALLALGSMSRGATTSATARELMDWAGSEHVADALRAIRNTGDAVAILDACSRHAADADPRTRAAAAEGLAETPNANALELLLVLASDPDEGVRLTAIRSLAAQHGERPVERLVATARAATTTAERIAAIESLRAHLDSPAVLQLLRGIAADPADLDVQAAAGRALEGR